ncbi:MAG: carbon-nitrogen hydrolase family protein [Pseudomonadota bacterium]
MKDQARTLRVAAVQLASMNHDVSGNLSRAMPLLDEAARQGARLILLPEFLPTGYIFHPSIWDAAEPASGPTARWLSENARRLGVYVGTSFLEADGEDFYNTFVLAGPDGAELGRVRKQTPAAAEAFFTRGEDGTHVISTPLGNIGVGICFENQLAYIPRLMHEHGADILLMPHSAPTPALPLFKKFGAGVWERLLASTPGNLARALGIPALFVNKCGPWQSPLPFFPLFPQKSRFPGRSVIVDADGQVVKSLGDGPGVAVADLVLDPQRKAPAPPKTHGRWSLRGRGFLASFFALQAVGAAWYNRSEKRREKARAVSRPMP